jgi:hypothetical protein
MGWSLLDLSYFEDVAHLNGWIAEIIEEMERERKAMEK